MQLRTRPLQENFGIEILDVDLATLDDTTFDAIYKLWQRDPLLLLRRQSLTERELVAYSRRFGDLDLIVRGDMHSPQNPEVIYITNLKRPDGTSLGGLGNHEVHWHHDQIYRQRPASGSIFYAAEVPEHSGCTSFCNTALAYDRLPVDLKAQVAGRRATCKYGLDPKKGFQREALDEKYVKEVDSRTPPATHDMVLVNPVTGQKSLYVDPNKTFAIEGMSDTEARALLDALFAHTERDEFVYTHAWRNGDVIMWDNARLWHRREPFDATLPRFAKRTTIFLRPQDFAVPEPELTAAASA